ncbi:MAG: hypothetical protein AB1505_17605 [Candidatus Latescibacterota bacterium]
MLAKIVGVVLLVVGAGMALSAVAAVVVGTLAFAVLAVKVAVVVGLLLVGWHWVHQESIALRILGALALVGGVAAAFPVAGALVAGTFGAIGLAVKVAVTAALLYLGWRWVKTGTFSVSGRRDLLDY